MAKNRYAVEVEVFSRTVVRLVDAETEVEALQKVLDDAVGFKTKVTLVREVEDELG